MNDRVALLLAGGLIALAALLAYCNSFSGPLVFDDAMVTEDNPTIRHLLPLWMPLSPPADSTIGGRPVLNLSFALNYAAGGLQVGGYHAINLLIHILAGLTLFAVARRTLLQPALRERFGPDALPLAAAAALLWVVHPVQTESVTYISQRAESLMGLFYLLTLYCFIRATESPARKTAWSVACVTACLLGMGTKEVMVSAPLMALLYDRTFIAGTFREAWRRRWKLHLCLMATWLPLAWLLSDVSKRSVGLGLGVSPWNYALTQAGAIVHYLVLTIWPHPLVIDYGTKLVSDPWQVAPQAVIVLALLAATVWALARRPALGFAGAWFFLILAPTSSFIPLVLDPVTEHRLYLPLAAPVALAVLGLYTLIGRNGGYVVAALALVLGLTTFLRNEDYRSSQSLWAQTLAAEPENPRVLCDYGEALVAASRPAEAVTVLERAIRLRPDFIDAYNDLGLAHAEMGIPADAIACYQEALRIKPDFFEARLNWGNVLLQEGLFPEAIGQYQEALRINPNCAEARFNWGNALARMGRIGDAVEQYQAALQINPDQAETQDRLGNFLSQLGRFDEADEHFRAALRLRPDDALIHDQRGNLLFQMGRFPEAVDEYRASLAIAPGNAPAHNNYGAALLQLGRKPEAIAQFQDALRVDPTYSRARDNLTRLGAPLP